MMSYLLGIDAGTTRTAAAVSRSGARPGEIEIVNLGDRASAVPSVLYIGDDGAVVVGDAAERRAVTDPDHVVREFKRRIGDPTPVVVSGRPWAPEDLSARLIRWVVERVAQREGGPAAAVAVTHPASWGAHKKDMLGAALAAQGLPVTFLAEPQAAALHYAAAERVEPGSTIAVYDLGGGTFDAAVVHKDGRGFGLIGRPEGLEHLGGVDFDEVVFEHVLAGMPEAFDGLDDADPAALAAVAVIRRECRDAKEALSSDTEVAIPVLLPGARGSVRLHRSEFEAMIRPQVEETVSALRRAVGSANLAPEQLSAVLLVGGSSRIPLVAQLVSEQLGRPVAVDADPKNAIAKGAALSLAPNATSASVGMPPPPGPRRAPAGPPPIGALPPPGPPGGFRPGPSAATGGYPGGHGQGGGLPPTQRVAASGAMPPPPPPQFPDRPPTRPAADPPRFGPDFDEDERGSRRGRSPGVLVSAGGAAAAVAVIAAVFLWPSGASGASGSIGTDRADNNSTLTSPPPGTSEDATSAPTPGATSKAGGNSAQPTQQRATTSPPPSPSATTASTQPTTPPTTPPKSSTTSPPPPSSPPPPPSSPPPPPT